MAVRDKVMGMINVFTGKRKFNEAGEELMDPTPIALPVGHRRPLTLQETLAMFIRSPGFRDQVTGEEFESFEESEDFDMDDDVDPSAPYEKDFDLASVASAQHGITKPPEVTEKVSKFMEERPFRKKNRPKGGDTPAPTAKADSPPDSSTPT